MKVYTIGRDPSNQIEFQQEVVSNFHATLEIYDDGRMIIKDHSTNGTFVNGQQINRSSRPVRRGDLITFADSSAQLNWAVIPVKKVSQIKAWHIALPVFLLLLLFTGYATGLHKNIRFSKPTIKEANEKYKNSVGLLTHAYYFYTENPNPSSDDETLIYVGRKKSGRGYAVSFKKEDLDPFFHTGTGFLIGGSTNLRGNIITNRHVVNPNWLNQMSFNDKATEDIVIGIEEAVNTMINSENEYYDFTYKSMDVEIRFFPGEADFEIGVHQNTSDLVEFTKSAGYKCIKLENEFFPGVDLFLLRGLRIDESRYHFISVNEEVEYYPTSNLEDLDEVLLIGFSGGVNIITTFDAFDKVITSESISGKISKITDQNISYDIGCLAGSSGSPVFNLDGKLIAINSAGTASGSRCIGVSASHLLNLNR